MPRLTPEDRYTFHLRRQQKSLDDFAAHETEWADDLLMWYRLRNEDIPDDTYRGAVYFLNREYALKPGSLTMLYLLYNRLMAELPAPTKELAFDLLGFRFAKYAHALDKGGY